MFGRTISCKHEGTHASPNRQVLTAPCQQPKINKILSARNLLKHIHLAVLGKERQAGGKEELSPRDLFYRTEEDPGVLLLPAPCPGWPEAPELWEEGEELEKGWGAPSFPPSPTLHHPALVCPPPLRPAPSRPRLPSYPADQRPQVSPLMPPGCGDLRSRSLMLPDSGQAGHLWIHPLLESGLTCVCARRPQEPPVGRAALSGEHPYGERWRASD